MLPFTKLGLEVGRGLWTSRNARGSSHRLGKGCGSPGGLALPAEGRNVGGDKNSFFVLGLDYNWTGPGDAVFRLRIEKTTEGETPGLG